jgi:hypothetical protein
MAGFNPFGSRGFTSANDIIAISDFDNTVAKHSGGIPVVIFEYEGKFYTRYKDLMTPEEIEQLASLIREFDGYRIPFHIVSWADEVLLKQYLQHVLPPDAFALISDKIHGSFEKNYIPKSITINSFRNGNKVIFIDDDEKNIKDVRTNVTGALAIKAEPGESSANMVALRVATLRDKFAIQITGMDGGRKHKKGKSKSKRKTKKSKRKTMKK